MKIVKIENNSETLVMYVDCSNKAKDTIDYLTMMNMRKHVSYQIKGA